MKSDELVSKSLENMLSNLPPEVAERVRAKYEADREEFLAYARSNTPSQSPAYWARSSCAGCHGRGIIGELTKLGSRTPLVCSCTTKSYQKWLTDARRTFNELKKEKGNEPTGT